LEENSRGLFEGSRLEMLRKKTLNLKQDNGWPDWD